MKKTLLIIGVILLIAAVICFGVSMFFRWAAYSVLDGTAELYARLFRRYHLFLLLGAGSLLSGAVLLVISRILKPDGV